MATPRPGQRAPFGPTLALTVILAVAGFAVVMPLPLLAIDPVALPPPIPPQNQRAETLVYLLAFAVILPLALVAGRRLADRIGAGGNGSALPALSGLLAAALAAAVGAVRLAGVLELGDGVGAVLAAAALWWAGAAAVLLRAARPQPWPALLRLARRAAPVWAVAAALLFGALLCFADLGSVSPLGLALGAVLTAGAVAAHGRLGAARPLGRWGTAADAALIAVLLLVVPDLVIFRPEDAAANPLVAIETGIFQFHQNFLLGPANEVLHGRAMLVDTASQYGVGSIYLLAAWFRLAPIGYGTLGLLTGAMTALWFAAGYCVVRLGGVSRPLAAAALGIGVVALIFNLTYPVGALPQSGPLRFGLPMAVLLAIVAGERFPARARAARACALAVIGVAAIWSLEGLAYTLIVFGATTGAQAWLSPPPGRLRRLGRRAAEAVIACACGHVLFAAATLAAAGRLPDWGQYLAYLREFLFGDLGDLTYDVARWTPALPLGVAYLASAAAFAELARRGGGVVERERTALVAIAGTTTYGIALLSYYVDRSQGHILMHVAPPGLLMGALWLGLLLRSHATVPNAVRSGGLAFGLAVGVLLVAVAWSSIGERLPRSALAHAVPRTLSLRDALDRLWHPPPLNRGAPAGERALHAHMPGERTSLVMVSPDLGIEILLRSGRVDRLFLGDPWEASFVAADELPALAEAVDALRPGVRMLMDKPAREVLARLRAQPSLDPRDNTVPALAPLAPLQRWALKRIDQRFRLRPVAPARDGFTVVELRRRG
jgi:hypothetical protein